MRQLALKISPLPQPSLDNFVPGANAELVARLRDFRTGEFPETVLYLWGETGSGKSHLLRACPGVHAVDDAEDLDEAAQIGLFNTINEAFQAGGRVLVAGSSPPAQLPLRDDLRSRLAQGLVYQVKPLSDAERASFLRAEAARRGMRVPEEVIGYLLTHVRRDLHTLTAILDETDKNSLERQRQVTLPLVIDVLKALEE